MTSSPSPPKTRVTLTMSSFSPLSPSPPAVPEVQTVVMLALELYALAAHSVITSGAVRPAALARP